MAGNTFSIRRPLIGLAIVSLATAVLPYVGLQEYSLSILTLGLFFAVYAMSWDLLFGYAGEANFGATFLIGTGAYTAALMSSNGVATPLICVAAGAAGAVVAGAVLAFPALRLRGPYFGLVTLVAVLIMRQLIILFSDKTGGEIGIAVPDVIAVEAATNFHIALGLAAVTALVLYLLVKSPFGLILEAIGQDPVNAQVLGFNIVKYKLTAFCISAFFSGLAGGLMTFYLGTASTNVFVDASVGVQIIIAAIVGGRRTVFGPILGALFMAIASEYLRPLGSLSELAVALIALIVLFFLPGGLLGLVRLARRPS
ncbi:branched-chain amino acid transport system permease protein [Neorhizobium sp. 2083]|uniref:branched-chain amino acid ABC transporter permease n=1 Tax=Neorhizobium sp. 2083 TaxID=2817762 RepID=UPI0028654AFF|nr:branched-chain amino acid ABC transporter permease [Neorhizobium sp. 2083]MDR6820913.1 branched-chain amino acid transport system permease protein [Neorhizobium sp. 2083]